MLATYSIDRAEGCIIVNRCDTAGEPAEHIATFPLTSAGALDAADCLLDHDGDAYDAEQLEAFAAELAATEKEAA